MNIVNIVKTSYFAIIMIKGHKLMGGDMGTLSENLHLKRQSRINRRRHDIEQGLSEEARACYEAGVVAEARAIAEWRSNKPATAEHLRVLLYWLDGCSSSLALHQPEDVGGENDAPF